MHIIYKYRYIGHIKLISWKKDAVFSFYFNNEQFSFKSRKGNVLKQINSYLSMNVSELLAQTK